MLYVYIYIYTHGMKHHKFEGIKIIKINMSKVEEFFLANLISRTSFFFSSLLMED